jgi:hypothetical protein
MPVYYVEDDATNTYGWHAVAAWAATTAYTVGQIVRQAAAVTAGNERCFICGVAGTSLASEPTWTLTRGATTTETAGPSWRECTGYPAVNGDSTNTPAWTAATSTATFYAGIIIKNTASTYYFLKTTSSGNTGASEPTWNTGTGATTSDGSNVWTCIGAISSFSATYAAPHARINNAIGTYAAVTAYVSNRHAEVWAASSTLGSAGTAAAPNYVICCDHATTPPVTLATTSSITNSSGAYYIRITGYLYVYGVAFSTGATSGSGYPGSSNTSGVATFEKCTWNIPNSTALSFGYTSANIGSASNISLIYCTFNFGNSASLIALYANTYILFKNMSCTGTAPSPMFTLAGTYALEQNIKVVDSDLSLCTGNLVNLNSGATICTMNFSNCKLGAGVTLTTSTHNAQSDGVYFYNCASDSTNYKYYVSKYAGTVTQETTTVRTGGASDGVTPISWKAISSANSLFMWPMVLDPIVIWNETTGSSVTATVEIAGGAALNNDNIWMEVEYLGDASYCTGSVASNQRGLLSAAAAVTSSSASWGGSPSSTQKLQVSFTPQKKGPIVARVSLAKVSTTVYVDPKITLT